MMLDYFFLLSLVMSCSWKHSNPFFYPQVEGGQLSAIFKKETNLPKTLHGNSPSYTHAESSPESLLIATKNPPMCYKNR